MKGLALPIIILSLFSLPAIAADSPDQKFVKEAALANMAEIELANLANEKASNDAVKQFAQRVLQDHDEATNKLKEIAAQKNIALPTDLDSSHKRARDKLAKKSGADFDKEFMETMVKDHKKTVKDFDKEAKNGKDADVKALAGELAPVMHTHLEQAQQVEKEVKMKKTSSN